MILLIFIFLTLVSLITLFFFETNSIDYYSDSIEPDKPNINALQLNIFPFLNDSEINVLNENINNMDLPNNVSFDSESPLSKIDLTIESLNIDLKQCLNTLVYIFKMESNFQLLESDSQLDELRELRTMLRKKALKITKELVRLNNFKTNDIGVEFDAVA